MFEEAHESLHRLRRVFSGEASQAEADRAASHLLRCRRCRLLAARAIAAQKASGPVVALGRMRPLLEILEIEEAGLAERLEAQSTWTEIRALTGKALRDKVRMTRGLHTVSFVEVLLHEGEAGETPNESEEVFYLALLAAGLLPSSQASGELKSDLCAECCAALANARRRRAKWLAARDALKKGMGYAEKGARNGVAEANLLLVEGSLEDDLGNAEEAARLLRRAAGLFEVATETFLKCKALVRLAYTLVDLDPDECRQTVEQALVSLPAGNPRLALFAEDVRINGLLNLGAPEEALLRFGDLEELYEQFREPYIQIRRQFTAARILEHLGRTKRAEGLFQEVIAGDLEHGLIRDFFLDLAYLLGFYLRLGQKEEAVAVCRRAREELPLLEDDEGSGEAAREQMLEVWRSLEEEIRRGRLDLGATNVLRSYIKTHWRAPAAEVPSFQR